MKVAHLLAALAAFRAQAPNVRIPQGRGPLPVNPPGTKLLKRFNKSGNRASHANKPQFPCYGRRSQRQRPAVQTVLAPLGGYRMEVKS